MNDRCETCAAVFVADPGTDVEEWQCRRRAPRLGGGMNSNEAVWPIVAIDDWCFEFVRQGERRQGDVGLFYAGDDDGK